jgi:hypothetical protein
MSEDNFLSWLESNHLDKDYDIWHIRKLEVKKWNNILQGGSRVELLISRPCGGKGDDVSKFVNNTVGYGEGFCNHPVVLQGSSHQSKHFPHLLNVSIEKLFHCF